MRPVRSITLHFQARSRLRCCTGLTVASMTVTAISFSAMRRPMVSTAPLPKSVPGRHAFTGTTAAAVTSRSMARASPTASSRRASGERTVSSRGPAGPLRVGWRTRPRPTECAISGSAGLHLAHLVPVSLVLVSFEELDRLPRHYRGNGMFVDELGMGVATQKHAEIIEPGNDALKLHAIDQEDGNRRAMLAHVIQEYILDILRFFRRHGDSPYCHSWRER